MELFRNRTDTETEETWHSKWIYMWGKKSLKYIQIDATGTVD